MSVEALPVGSCDFQAPLGTCASEKKQMSEKVVVSICFIAFRLMELPYTLSKLCQFQPEAILAQNFPQNIQRLDFPEPVHVDFVKENHLFEDIYPP